MVLCRHGRGILPHQYIRVCVYHCGLCKGNPRLRASNGDADRNRCSRTAFDDHKSLSSGALGMLGLSEIKADTRF